MPRKKKPASEIPEAISRTSSLYNKEWVEEAAVKGWHKYLNILKDTTPKPIPEGVETELSIIYYTAFEDALNAFLRKCMDDTITTIELCLSEFGKITANIHQELNK